MIKHQVGHGWSDHRPQAHIGIGPHHRLSVPRGRGWRRHKQIVRRGTAIFEHLDGTNSGGQVVIFWGTVAIQGRAMVEEVFECPVVSQALEQVVVRMRMGVHQARQHQAPAGIETVGVGCTRQCLTNSPDAICVDKDIGLFKSRV